MQVKASLCGIGFQLLLSFKRWGFKRYLGDDCALRTGYCFYLFKDSDSSNGVWAVLAHRQSQWKCSGETPTAEMNGFQESWELVHLIVTTCVIALPTQQSHCIQSTHYSAWPHAPPQPILHAASIRYLAWKWVFLPFCHSITQQNTPVTVVCVGGICVVSEIWSLKVASARTSHNSLCSPKLQGAGGAAFLVWPLNSGLYGDRGRIFFSLF